MGDVATFNASTRLAVLSELAASPDPLRLIIEPDDAVREVAPSTELIVGQGRLLWARSHNAEGLGAFARVAWIDRGRIRIETAPPPAEPPEAFPPIDLVYAEAEAEAEGWRARVAELGGLTAQPLLDGPTLDAEAARIPEQAMVVARLANEGRTLGGVLAESPFDVDLTLMVLERLAASGVLVVDAPRGGQEARPTWTGWDRGTSQPESEVANGWGMSSDDANGWGTAAPGWGQDRLQAPLRSARPRPATRPPVRVPLPRSGTPHNYPPPVSVATPEPPQAVPEPPPPIPTGPVPAAPMSVSPLGVRPLTPRPAPAYTEDEDLLQQAAFGSKNNRIAAVMFAALLGLIAWALLRQGSPPQAPAPKPVAVVVAPPPAPAPPVEVTPPPPPPEPAPRVRRTRPQYSFSNPPPVAGPGANADVRAAEELHAEGRLDEAEEALASLRRRRPRDVAVWVLSGIVADDRGDPASAKKYVARALRTNKRAYRAWVLKGALAQGEDNVLAVESYNTALELEPDHAMSRELRSIAHRLGSRL